MPEVAKITKTDGSINTDKLNAESQNSLFLPYSFSKQHGVCQNGRALFFKEKISLPALAEIQRALNYKPEIQIINATQFSKLLQDQHEASAMGNMQNLGGIDEVLDLNTIVDELGEPEDILEHDNNAPVIKLLNALMTEAIRKQASDIHIEQYEERLRIRFRVDGSLNEVLEPDSKIAPLIISRVKVMAKLDISEKRLPQDGRISIKIGGRAIDVRVSTIPTGNGLEKVVMRLLSKETSNLDLDYLGMPKYIKEKVEQIIAKPHGILLVTGPTGSGKTTSLYSMLSKLNNKERNIMTVEDPVEYYIDGINQSQVNSKIGMSFASGLRSILRQDPDIIMIGEIRDTETAQIAIQASLTGHVVFSTLHTNTAHSAISRLRDMEIEPFLLGSSLNGVLAQRLVRTLCSCKSKTETTSAQIERLRIKKTATIYEANGCELCNFTGFKGRKGVFDLLVVDETIKTMIHNNEPETAIKKHIRQYSKGMIQMGIDFVLAGDTSLDEIIRVAGGIEEET